VSHNIKAFPSDFGINIEVGMTLRDYIAIKAMPIALRLHEDISEGHIPYVDEEGEPVTFDNEGDYGTWYPHSEHFARCCYAIADNFMKVRDEDN
tara:strand:+ start:219 stop:500 length:282 start_codon:yes stop_codon:yes gene_type:complete